MVPLATERACQMFTAQQYRAKAAEFRAFLTHTPRSQKETREFLHLEHALRNVSVHHPADGAREAVDIITGLMRDRFSARRETP